MKTKIIILIGLFMFISFLACNKELDVQKNVTAYTYTKVDEKAGQWKPVFLTNVTDITVATPVQTNTAEYLASLASLKSISASITSEQKAAIEFWGANSICLLKKRQTSNQS